MSLKTLSLGRVVATGRGILCTGSTNATPIVLTVNAGHGLKPDDRIAVSGITGNTAANGEWTISAVAATTVTLRGSVGNGTHGGTPLISVICDRTPFGRSHDVLVMLNNEILVGTVDIQGSDDNVTFATVVKGVALGANPGQRTMEVRLKPYMILVCSAFTSGALNAALVG